MGGKVHVVTIAADGTVSCLRTRRGEGLDLRGLGQVEARRVSEIVWDDTEQAWYVQILSELIMEWMTGVWVDEQPAGEMLWTHWVEALGGARILEDILNTRGNAPFGCRISMGRMFFKDYEDAVAAEVKFLDALRLKGIVPG